MHDAQAHVNTHRGRDLELSYVDKNFRFVIMLSSLEFLIFFLQTEM